MSDTAQDLTCKCGAPLSEHSIDGQYDGGCFRTRCAYFEKAKTPSERGKRTRQHEAAVAAKREHAALIEERDQLAALCAAWRELAQAEGIRAIAERQNDTVAASLASEQATEARRRLRELGIPKEQLR